ncbi:hypothetical protein HK098_004458 [Nowakowskiella sp. JEL0407]|nr:hypothetical protein HK098_004458 [Nowakowskiella sp. JEL0407]
MQNLNVLVGTWNVGMFVPISDSVDLSSWLLGQSPKKSRSPDVVVLGFQELLSQPQTFFNLPTRGYSESFSNTIPSESSILSIWVDIVESCLEKNFPDFSYRPIFSRRLCALGLLVFVRDDKAFKWSVGDVRSGHVGLGLVGLYGNKGAIAVQLELLPKKDSTSSSATTKSNHAIKKPISLCFINSHLQAHEGATYFDLRKDDMTYIFDTVLLESSKRDQTEDEPIGLSGHEAVWIFGDFNFRLVGSPLPSGVYQAIDNKDYDQILNIDELSILLKSKTHKYLRYFNEHKITFPPSYKFRLGVDESAGNVGAALKYSKTRVPAYCDRILYSTVPELTQSKATTDMLTPLCEVAQEWYSCATTVNYSDHKPVSGLYTVKQISESTQTKDLTRGGLESLRVDSAVSVGTVRREAVLRGIKRGRVVLVVLFLVYLIYRLISY